MVKKNVQKNVNIKNQGSRNGRWSGGKGSYYTNHYQRKLNRKQKIKDCDNKCEECGKDNLILNAHSIDGDKNNHDITNLKMLCAQCLGSKSNSKYKKKFGNTLMELCHEFDVSLTTLYKFVDIYTTKAKLKKAVEKYNKDKLSKTYGI
jgi:hypothetical protein